MTDISGTPTPGLDSPEWSAIPETLQGGLTRYIEHRIPPGHFLRSVLSGDLFGAMEAADIRAKTAMPFITVWLLKYCRCDAYGSRSVVDEWLSKREAAA